MDWTVAAPFINKVNLSNEFWLTRNLPNSRHQLHIVPRPKPLENWHNQKSSVTGFKSWLIYWQHGMEAIKQTKGGVITLFPQLPAVIGMQQRLTWKKRIPVVAWLFNVGTCSTGIRQAIAQLSLENIDCFVVHTRREVDIYHHWLGIPKERFEFVPYHQSQIPITYEENTTHPFIAALGSAHRDFSTFFQAVSKLNLPTVVASSKHALEGLTVPPNVKTPFGIERADCLRLAQEARLSVVPLLPKSQVTAAGQITIVEAMLMGRAIIATRCHGAEDYIQHGETGLLVEPKSVDDLVQAIEMLWNDSALRNRLGQAAKRYAEEHFSCDAAGAALGRILDKVADAAGMY
ncbi:glycosyltransferase family 4 protein [Brasilonema sp. UFV-L1]|uniref:glycosyltransferase family 4 protein n=1 Tax=Brasilonema sp. UFV-L1 TaxID=2234130 RepID=UPI00145D9BE6|nr:glycosyltransferase family 4 protein [Brasilonema sp. UFV-L1]NMG06803.1 glycosyltransferase [Brasilonema sp. UFV-L1]